MLRISLEAASEQLVGLPVPFAVLFERGDASVELFAPRGMDTQQPHDRDEIYIIASGTGTFRRGADRAPFAPGDLLFVAAGVPHAFESFSDDFRTWVILLGTHRRSPATSACPLTVHWPRGTMDSHTNMRS